jgi:tetratricopeptide (TPR) repeat protein
MPALLLAAALATPMQPSGTADDICYDRAIVGHIRHAENFVGLDHFVQAEPRALIMGGRWDIDIGVDQVLAGAPTPATIKARVVLTDLFTPKSTLLILLKQGPVDADKDNTVQEWNGRFIPRASTEIPWRVVLVETWRRGFDPRDPSFPPRCSLQIAPIATSDMLAKGDAASAAQQYDQARDWYRRAAERGNATAEDRIGEMYQFARGVPEDMGQAMNWYRKAADQGDAVGETSVGLLYGNGWGVHQDYGQALIWYRKAANQGYAIAAEFVGIIYNNGLGVPADFDQARVWFDKAVAGGDAAAEIPLCAPYEVAWHFVGSGKNVAAMDHVIAGVDPYCVDLLTRAKARRDEIERTPRAAQEPAPR